MIFSLRLFFVSFVFFVVYRFDFTTREHEEPKWISVNASQFAGVRSRCAAQRRRDGGWIPSREAQRPLGGTREWGFCANAARMTPGAPFYPLVDVGAPFTHSLTPGSV